MSNPTSKMGFKPVKRLDGAAYTGAVTPYRIASAYNTTIGCGDPVIALNTGYINRSAGTDQFRGIFVGCTYIDATGMPVKSNYWPASTVTFGSADVTAFVIDDPNVIFEVTTDVAISIPADLGASSNTTMGTVNTANGISGADLTATSPSNSNYQWRIVEVVNRPGQDLTAAQLAVWVAPNYHDFRQANSSI